MSRNSIASHPVPLFTRSATNRFLSEIHRYITAKLEMARVLREKKSHIRANSLGVRTKYIEKYTDDFDRDLLTHIQHITAIIDQQLIPCCVIEENKVFYYKMLADYFRHPTDFFGENSKEEYVDAISESLANYRYAMELGQRLGGFCQRPICRSTGRHWQ